MLYTDWGIFQKGSPVSTDGETNPRLEIGDGEVTFRGTLHGPSWNGVQTAPVAGPELAYRLTYRVVLPNVLRVTIGVTSAVDRADVSAFLAYRLPLRGIARWRATGAKEAEGASGAAPGQRVYQGSAAPDSIGALAFRLEGEAGTVTFRGFGGTPALPQNPFLVDGGAGGMQLFYALLDGGATSFQAGVERVAEFEMVLE